MKRSDLFCNINCGMTKNCFIRQDSLIVIPLGGSIYY